jgi:hypothetical protein
MLHCLTLEMAHQLLVECVHINDFIASAFCSHWSDKALEQLSYKLSFGSWEMKDRIG